MSTTKLLALALAATLFACGSKSTPPEAPAEEPAHAPAEEDAPAEADAEAPAPAEPPPPAEPDPAQVKADLLAAETAAYEAAKPVFEKHCVRCHQEGQKKAKKKILEHLNITTYPFTGEHGADAGPAIRKVLAIGGGKAVMPADTKGAVQGEELALVAAWADAWDKSHAGGAHEGQPGHEAGAKK